ncbi:CsbD family protein [Planctomicrobium sp. SH661]|uniref:CsbD family protein n=1 Tax=Planctomicrobium sp. SH661 TaxID=3448124 RepID=UPI003F5B7779
MLTRQELEGKWKQIKGQIRERWGEFSDDDFQQVKGDAEKLVGVLQQKTGQSRREIEAFLDKAAHDGQAAVQQVTENARNLADAAGRKIQEGYDTASKKVQAGFETASKSLQDGYQAAEAQLEAGYDEAKQMVRSRPLESVIAAFGAGIISGVVVSLLLRSNHRA